MGDHLRYQVLEAQPEVVEALDEAGRGARTVRRSIHLTPFGADFCALCIPPTTAEFDALRQSVRDESPPVAILALALVLALPALAEGASKARA